MQMIWRQVKSTENDSRQRVFCADPLGTLAMLMVCINPAAYHAQRYGLMMSPLDKCENANARRCVQSKALTAQCRSMEFDGWLNGKGFLHSCVSLEAACKELLLVVTSGWAKCKYPAVLSNSSEYFHEWIDFLYIFIFMWQASLQIDINFICINWPGYIYTKFHSELTPSCRCCGV